jgi:hypothetical protein
MTSVHTYLIRRISSATGVEHEMEMMLTPDQYEEIQPFLIGKQREAGSRFLQDILPSHSPIEREFILTGMTEVEWHQLFGEPDYGTEFPTKP